MLDTNTGPHVLLDHRGALSLALDVVAAWDCAQGPPCAAVAGFAANMCDPVKGAVASEGR